MDFKDLVGRKGVAVLVEKKYPCLPNCNYPSQSEIVTLHVNWGEE